MTWKTNRRTGKPFRNSTNGMTKDAFEKLKVQDWARQQNNLRKDPIRRVEHSRRITLGMNPLPKAEVEFETKVTEE